MSLRQCLLSQVRDIHFTSSTCYQKLVPLSRLTQPSDVLTRHLRKCEKAINSEEMGLLLKERRTRQSRTKRACELCARSKSKCDLQTPCGRCSRRSTTCFYSRERPQPMCTLYEPRPGRSSPVTANEADWSFPESAQLGGDVFQLSPAGTDSLSLGSLNLALESGPGQDTGAAGSTIQCAGTDVYQAQQPSNQQDLFQFDPGTGFTNFGFATTQDMYSDLNSMSLFLDGTGFFERLDNSAMHSATEGGELILYQSS